MKWYTSEPSRRRGRSASGFSPRGPRKRDPSEPNNWRHKAAAAAAREQAREAGAVWCGAQLPLLLLFDRRGRGVNGGFREDKIKLNSASLLLNPSFCVRSAESRGARAGPGSSRAPRGSARRPPGFRLNVGRVWRTRCGRRPWSSTWLQREALVLCTQFVLRLGFAKLQGVR